MPSARPLRPTLPRAVDAPVPEPDLLSPAEAAAACGVTTKTLSRWAASGRLRAVVTLGGHHRYPLADIERIAGFGSRLGPEPPDPAVELP